MDWSADKTASGAPMAVLKDGEKVVAKVYLSPDFSVLRVTLPELQLTEQLKVDVAHHIVDFRRKP